MDDAWSFRELKAFVRESKTLSNKKKEYLLTEEDISKFDVRKKFIERNLVDTRYELSSMPFKNTLELTRLIQKFPWFVANLHLN